MVKLPQEVEWPPLFLNTLSRHLNASGGEVCLPLAQHAYWDGDSLTPDMLNEKKHIQLMSP